MPSSNFKGDFIFVNKVVKIMLSNGKVPLKRVMFVKMSF